MRFVAPFPCSARMRAAHALAVTCHEYATKGFGRHGFEKVCVFSKGEEPEEEPRRTGAAGSTARASGARERGEAPRTALAAC